MTQSVQIAAESGMPELDFAMVGLRDEVIAVSPKAPGHVSSACLICCGS